MMDACMCIYCIYSCYSVPVNQYLPWFAGLEYLTPEVKSSCYLCMDIMYMYIHVLSLQAQP